MRFLGRVAFGFRCLALVPCGRCASPPAVTVHDRKIIFGCGLFSLVIIANSLDSFVLCVCVCVYVFPGHGFRRVRPNDFVRQPPPMGGP